jgi:hypothetical protein|tara:strand:- start:19441 stop:19680 length:240 start_codon:yes stop_codon:yes gene_type:complete
LQPLHFYGELSDFSFQAGFVSFGNLGFLPGILAVLFKDEVRLSSNSFFHWLTCTGCRSFSSAIMPTVLIPRAASMAMRL